MEDEATVFEFLLFLTCVYVLRWKPRNHIKSRHLRPVFDQRGGHSVTKAHAPIRSARGLLSCAPRARRWPQASHAFSQNHKSFSCFRNFVKKCHSHGLFLS